MQQIYLHGSVVVSRCTPAAEAIWRSYEMGFDAVESADPFQTATVVTTSASQQLFAHSIHRGRHGNISRWAKDAVGQQPSAGHFGLLSVEELIKTTRMQKLKRLQLNPRRFSNNYSEVPYYTGRDNRDHVTKYTNHDNAKLVR